MKNEDVNENPNFMHNLQAYKIKGESPELSTLPPLSPKMKLVVAPVHRDAGGGAEGAARPHPAPMRDQRA